MPRMPPPITSRSYTSLPSRSRASARPGSPPAAGRVPGAWALCGVGVIGASALLAVRSGFLLASFADRLVPRPPAAEARSSALLVVEPAHGRLHGLEPLLVLLVAL